MRLAPSGESRNRASSAQGDRQLQHRGMHRELSCAFKTNLACHGADTAEVRTCAIYPANPKVRRRIPSPPRRHVESLPGTRR